MEKGQNCIAIVFQINNFIIFLKDYEMEKEEIMNLEPGNCRHWRGVGDALLAMRASLASMHACWRWPRWGLLILACQAGTTVSAAPVSGKLLQYKSSVSRDGNGPLDLRAELNYDESRTNTPIAVVMHAYGSGGGNDQGLFIGLRPNAQRLRDAGFFVITVAMRGRENSDGRGDSGGVEIYDIYDAIETVKIQYADLVDPGNISITGYSGGGGNAMSALTKFPDYFRAGSAYFGMSDYGHDTENGWYFKGADAGNKNGLNAYIGDPGSGNPAIKDRYYARASNLASRNNPYSEIHLFVNDNEWNCPPVNDTSYRDNAVAAASFPGEFNNIHVHVADTANPQYVDFNGDGKNDPGEKQYWPHQYPTADQQHAAEAWYMRRLLDGGIPQPQLKAAGELFVAGYIRTKSFAFWLGDGQNAAATLTYDLSAKTKTFAVHVLSSDPGVTGWLEVNTQDMKGSTASVLLDGKRIGQFICGGVYRHNALGDLQTLTLTTVTEP
ncbi:MAG: prolyl oligopeptidase family serine peptidase [Victivallales bacterium]